MLKQNIPFFSFEKRNHDIRSEAISAFEDFFDSSWYVLGKATTEFEQKYAEFSGTHFSVGVSTGLDALHLALRALDIGEGDEVIVPSNTYIASVLAVSYTGAKPVFVEPRIETANIDPSLIKDAITERTKCIMPVHLYGQPCEMDPIMSIAEEHDLYVVEDNAQAHGAHYKGKVTGSFGHINATSFYPTKNLGALGEAGAITTNDQELAEAVRVLRNYGSKERYYNEVIGYNNRIDEYEAAYLTIALSYLQNWNADRNRIAHFYSEALRGVEEIELLQNAEGAESVNHLFVVKTKKRDELRKFLGDKGIGTQIHYPIPPHLQEAYRHLGYEKGDFPLAEKLAAESLSLPIWPGLKEEQIEYVAKSIIEAFRG